MSLFKAPCPTINFGLDRLATMTSQIRKFIHLHLLTHTWHDSSGRSKEGSREFVHM